MNRRSTKIMNIYIVSLVQDENSPYKHTERSRIAMRMDPTAPPPLALCSKYDDKGQIIRLIGKEALDAVQATGNAKVIAAAQTAGQIAQKAYYDAQTKAAARFVARTQATQGNQVPIHSENLPYNKIGYSGEKDS